MKKRTLRVVYILCSTYDDDGYVLRYLRGILPSNSLACLKSLTRAVADSGELGDEIDVEIEIYDDTVQRIPVKRIARANRQPDTQVVVGLVGVQTNQFERASDLALELRGLGVPVMIGGFHVSGMLAMFKEPTPDLQRLLDRGVTLVKGEAEAPGALAGILRDAAAGELRPIYDIKELPDLTNAPAPEPDLEYLRHFKCHNMGTLDTSRGCPFNCSFCTIINVQGRRLRNRSASCILDAIRTNYARGIVMWFFTDDNFSRSPVWEEVFDGLAAMRAEGIDIRFMMQVDTRAYLIPRFAEKARDAGCYMAFIGMETVNPENIESMGKVQNDVEDYAHMVRCWHDHEVLVHVGYIIGLPHDTRESVRRDIDTLMNEILVDEASFFMLTPLPGSADHERMVRERIPIEADLNNYDSLHETFRHPRMAPGEWLETYHEAWESFYSKESITNMLLRTPRKHYWQMFWIGVWYRYSALTRSHPMFTGLVRLKDRCSRRPMFPREGLLRYGWRRLRDMASMARTYARLFLEFQEIWLLTRDPDDPRYATLADLRMRWASLKQRIEHSDLRGQCDLAAQEIRGMLAAASDRLQQLSDGSRSLNRRARRRLRRQADELRAYVQSLDVQMPSWNDIVAAERYIASGVLARYEEAAIAYVAQRRRFNAYRRELMQKLRSGRIFSVNIMPMPRLIAFELFMGVRFAFRFLTQV